MTCTSLVAKPTMFETKTINAFNIRTLCTVTMHRSDDQRPHSFKARAGLRDGPKERGSIRDGGLEEGGTSGRGAFPELPW